jgi:hypothetical protein
MYKPLDLLAIDLKNIPLIEQWCKARKEYALAEMLKGEKVPGWKLVRGKRPPKKWINEDETGTYLLASTDISEDILYTKKILSPTQLLKTKEGKAVEDKIKSLYSVSEGAPTIVPDTDKREEYNPVADTNEFNDLI